MLRLILVGLFVTTSCSGRPGRRDCEPESACYSAFGCC